MKGLWKSMLIIHQQPMKTFENGLRHQVRTKGYDTANSTVENSTKKIPQTRRVRLDGNRTKRRIISRVGSFVLSFFFRFLRKQVDGYKTYFSIPQFINCYGSGGRKGDKSLLHTVAPAINFSGFFDYN